MATIFSEGQSRKTRMGNHRREFDEAMLDRDLAVMLDCIFAVE